MSAPPTLDARGRDAVLGRLETERFDLAVIGAGITGAGIACEAARRGLTVAVLEARDFAAGTSSRSSKLIHGGLRYLAQGDVPLVRATALERKVVHRIAKHLAEPRWMVFPVRSRVSLLKMRAAVTTYEKLGAVADADLHRTWDTAELAREEPALDANRFPHACVYREYLTDDARLVLANLRSALAGGAAVLSHAPVEALIEEDGRACGLTARCALTGREVTVRARSLVNAAGPWVDAVRALEDATATPRLHLSKGVHVVLPAARLPVRHMVVLSTPDRRSIFVIRRGGGVYVGTTDTSYPGGWDEWPPVTRADVDYLLAPLAASFRGEPPSAADVVASWSGLRPLIGEAGVAPTEISRKDELWVGARGVVTVAGGKLTGYRPMARRAVELAADEAGLRLREAHEDGGLPLVGGDFAGGLGELAGSLASSQAGVAVDEPTRLRLAALYGAESGDVIALGAEPLAPGTPTVRGEVDWAVCHEGAVHLEDVLYRRMRTALYEPGARESLVAPLAARMQGLLGWSDARSSEEQRATRARLEADLHFSREESA